MSEQYKYTPAGGNRPNNWKEYPCESCQHWGECNLKEQCTTMNMLNRLRPIK